MCSQGKQKAQKKNASDGEDRQTDRPDSMTDPAQWGRVSENWLILPNVLVSSGASATKGPISFSLIEHKYLFSG